MHRPWITPAIEVC